MHNLLVTFRSYFLISMALLMTVPPAIAGDWPMWRYDSGHTASSPDDLPDQLTLLWTRKWDKRDQAWDDPLNNDLMTYDKIFEPVVSGKRMFLGFNDSDKLLAVDTENGKTLWTFYADGPIRFSPVATKDRVYTVSDDGYLYCLDSANGTIIWKFRGAPAAQKTLGNKRVISAWPARGGPVLYENTIYFAASIWPFMGTFIYALDAETGNVVWVNDSTSASYIKQPHGAPSFAGVAPQGTLVATDKLILIPGGRSVPAALDRKTGKLKYFHLGGKGNGGSFVIANNTEVFVHTRYRGVRSYNLKTGLPTLFVHNEPVLHDEMIYSAILKNKQPLIKAYKKNHQEIWSLGADGQGDMIRAGNRLYAAGGKTISAITLPQNKDQKPRIAWQLPIQEQVLRLLAADDKLFAVTSEGEIKAFGVPSDNVTPRPIAQKNNETLISERKSTQTMRTLLDLTQTKKGYAIGYGADNEPLFDAFMQHSPLRLIVIEEDLAKAQQLRTKYDSLGLYG
ncbi:MAG: PQQ-binding-like beta-propeller repeat protein, partial [Gimesia sp.]